MDLLSRFNGRVAIDFGTGDGTFVYESAQKNPSFFFIGIDANTKPLVKISERIYRKPGKGGVPNALFVRAAIENIPSELRGIAHQVFVLFPWGSLLRTVASADASLMSNLRSLCAENATLQILFSLDHRKDASEMARLGLPEFTEEYLSSTLIPGYREVGFDSIQVCTLNASHLTAFPTSWAKRLQQNRDRSFVHIRAVASGITADRF